MIRPEEISRFTELICSGFIDVEREIIAEVSQLFLEQAGSVLDFDTLNRTKTAAERACVKLEAYYRNRRDLIRRALRRLVKISQERDRAIYREAGIETKPIEKDPDLMFILLDEIDRTDDAMYAMFSISPRNGNTGFRKSFQNQLTSLLRKQANSIKSGKTVERATRPQIDALSAGIDVMTGKDGKTTKLFKYMEDVYSRCIAQSCGKVSLKQAQELGHDLMQMSAHIGARIGDGGPDLTNHSWWQGHVVSLSGKEGYLTLDDIGYGDMLGFLGINCRHSWYPATGTTSIYSQEYLDRINNATVEFQGKTLSVAEAEQKRNYWRRRAAILHNRAASYRAIGSTTEAVIAGIQANDAAARYKELDEKIGEINYG